MVYVIFVPTEDPVYTVTPSIWIVSTYLLDFGTNEKDGLLPVGTLTVWELKSGVAEGNR